MDREWLLNKLAQIRATGEYRVLRMDFPPATEEQLLETERRLGFPLPEELRMLYHEAGNGGDILNGGVILCGAVGGYSPWGPEKSATIDQQVSRSGWRLNERVDAELQTDPMMSVECEGRPERFVSFADLGCSMTAEWDGWSGRVYAAGVNRSLDTYLIERGAAPTPGSEKIYTISINYLAPSVDAFLVNAINYRLGPEWRPPDAIYAADGELIYLRPDDGT